MVERRLLRRAGGVASAVAIVLSGCQPGGAYGYELKKENTAANCYSNQQPFTEPVIVNGQNQVHVRFSSVVTCYASSGFAPGDVLSMGIKDKPMLSLDTIVDTVTEIPGR